jgi:hypothetical protein
MSNTSVLYSFYKGIGNAEESSALPPQAIPKSKKTKGFIKATLDQLEDIGTRQVSHNLKFRDYYKMTEGRLIYTDSQEAPDVVRDIAKIRDAVDLPTYIKHYDIIGIITNTLVTQYMNLQQKFRIDTTDEISNNEYLRDKKQRVQKYAMEQFEVELQKALLTMGLDPNKQDFSSQEEQQQYIQQLEGARQEYTPEGIQKDMRANWRTKAAEWGDNTWKRDYKRFRIEGMERAEAKDFFLTGRCFRHYHIGYDFYKPERWSTETTFFSQDVDAKYPQYGEYVGRIHYYSSSDIINRYGHLLTATEQERLAGYRGKNSEVWTSRSTNSSFKNITNNFFGENVLAPHENYFDHKIRRELEDRFGVMGGIETDLEGNSNPSYLPREFDDRYLGAEIAKHLRDDIRVRGDLIQVMEGYLRSYKRIGLITYRTKEGYLTQEQVTDDLVSGFLKENGIKRLKTQNLIEAELYPEENTIVYTYVPEVMKFLKINKENTYLKDHIYKLEPLEYQIRGNSNVYDVRLPVGGIISSSTALKLKPYQEGLNICMNQIYNLLEKEIGMFFLFDIQYLPSDFKNLGDTEDMLLELRDYARDVGFIPVDTSKQNTAGGNGTNTFMGQNITYVEQIRSRINLASFYKQEALQQIGISPGMLGQNGQYETEEGIKNGVNASMNQIEPVLKELCDAKIEMMDLHLAVAQFAQKSNKDITVPYSMNDNEKDFLVFTDNDFELRKLNVVPIGDSASRKDLEMLRQSLIQNNTMGGDIIDFAEVLTSDTILEISEVGRRARQKQQQELQATRAHEKEMMDKQLQAQAQEKEAEWQREEASKERDRQTDIEQERIKALGRASDKESDMEGFREINRQADLALKNDEMQIKQANKTTEIGNKKIKDEKEYELKIAELRLKVQELQTKNKISEDNKYIARINKN